MYSIIVFKAGEYATACVVYLFREYAIHANIQTFHVLNNALLNLEHIIQIGRYHLLATCASRFVQRLATNAASESWTDEPYLVMINEQAPARKKLKDGDGIILHTI